MNRVVQNMPGGAKRILKTMALALLKLRARSSGDTPDVVFILGHMRSGSTLLLHLLLTHPALLGYGERNLPYEEAKDLDRLWVDACYQRRQFFQSYRYLVDQINHDRFIRSEALLTHPRVRTLFLIREPQAALASMVDVLGQFYGMTLDDAVTYYTTRLQTLARYARQIEDPTQAFFLTYEDLTTHATTTLEGLQTFLDLPTGLSTDYQRFSFTGQRGDPSATIHSGRILSNKPRRPLALSPDILRPTRDAYDQCRRILTAHCQSPGAA